MIICALVKDELTRISAPVLYCKTFVQYLLFTHGIVFSFKVNQ